jgi:iron complex outermembrane recepter protein
MKTFSFLLLLVASLPTWVLAQNILRGQVIDAGTREPVPGAVIYIHDLKKGGVTSVDGFYLIEKLPKGRFVIESKMIGYASRVETVFIEGTTELNFMISSVATELQEVVVTGISHTTEIKTNPTAVSTIDLRALTENSSTNIIDNISRQPGLSQITTGTAISKPVIRGLGFNRIITMYDGIRQEGQQWGDEHGIEIDEFSVDRVEIIKGPGSLMYGSDGIGGVINFLPAEPLAENFITGRISSNYQSNNGLLGNSLMNAGNLKGYYWSARVSNKRARPYENSYDGKVFNSSFNETNGDALIGKNGRWGYTQFAISNFNQAVGLTEGERDEDGNFIREVNSNGSVAEAPVTHKELYSYHLFVPKQTINHFRIYNTSNLFFGESRFQFNIGYQRNKRKEFGNVLDEDEPELFFDLNTFTYNLIYFLPEKSGWSFSIGLGGMNQQNKNKGEEFLIPEYTLMDRGIFTYFKKHVDKLTLAGGLRYDYRAVATTELFLDEEGVPTDDKNAFRKFEAADRSFSNYSASTGISYEFSPQVHLKLNLSRGFRAPNLSELASNGQHEGSLRYEYGNLALKPEVSLQGDLSILLNTDHISAELSIFRSTIENFIFTRKLVATGGGDSIPDPENPSPAFKYAQGNANLFGGELVVDIHPHPLDWLHIEHSISFVRGVNNSRGIGEGARYLPFMPAPRYIGEVRGVFKKEGRFLSDLYAKVEFDYTWAQNRVLFENNTETPTSAYGLWNLGFGGQLNSSRGELLRLFVTVSNLLDNAYQSHLSRLKYAAENPFSGRTGVYNMGRNVSLKVVLPLVIKQPK